MAESVVLMIVFSIFAEAGCGATFGITPAVDPKNTGAVYGAGACCHRHRAHLSPLSILPPSPFSIIPTHVFPTPTSTSSNHSPVPCMCSGRGRQHGRSAVGRAVPVARRRATPRCVGVGVDMQCARVYICFPLHFYLALTLSALCPLPSTPSLPSLHPLPSSASVSGAHGVHHPGRGGDLLLHQAARTRRPGVGTGPAGAAGAVQHGHGRYVSDQGLCTVLPLTLLRYATTSYYKYLRM